jgi:hypothetical protein
MKVQKIRLMLITVRMVIRSLDFTLLADVRDCAAIAGERPNV